MRLPAALFAIGLLSQVANADTILLPDLTALAYGSGDSVWSTEIRVTNISNDTKQISIVDWIGTSGWRPKTWLIEPHATQSISGFEVLTDPSPTGTPVPLPSFGAAVAEVDSGLIVQIAVLTGIAPKGTTGDVVYCEPWNGGYIGTGGHFGPCGEVGPCNTGAGPVFDATSFFPARTTILLPWLHTAENRRTNLVLVNPDSVPANVTITVFAADGAAVESRTLGMDPHSFLQLNDIFSGVFADVRTHNASIPAVAGRAILIADTRFYSLATVISNLNNTVSVSLPRPSP